MSTARAARVLLAVTASLVLCSGVSAKAQATSAAPSTAQIAGPVLMVTDLERSLRFYTAGLGLAIGTRLDGSPGPGATIVAPGSGPAPFIFLRQRSKQAGEGSPIDLGQGLSRIMLSVSDLQGAADRLTAAGFTVPPLNGRKVFFVSDPDGYRYELMQAGARH